MALLRPATFTERFFLMTNSHSFMNTAYLLDVSTREPIEKRHVDQVVAALTSSVPVLRRGFECDPKTNDFWAKKLDLMEDAIDCQVLDACIDIKEELLRMATYKYDVSSGPLFQVHIFRHFKGDRNNSEDNEEVPGGNCKERDDEDTPTTYLSTTTNYGDEQELPLSCNVSNDETSKVSRGCRYERYGDVKTRRSEEFPHHFTIAFGIFHGAADGYTNLRILPHFLSLLNDTLEEKVSPIENSIEHSEGYLYTEEIIQNGIKQLNDQQTLVSLDKYLSSAAAASSKIVRVLSVKPNNQVIESKMIQHTFSEEETTRILALCKKESVSVNSFFTALINTAFLEMYVENLRKDRFDLGNETVLNITGEHTVDLRKYWSEEAQTLTVMGPHINMIQVSISTNFSLLDDTTKMFWPYAKEVHDEIKRRTSAIPLSIYIARERMYPVANLDDLVLAEGDPRSVFSVTNMGDITKNFDQEDRRDFVRLLDVGRCVAIHKMSMTTLHFLHSFRGRLTYDVVYSTKYFDQKRVSRLSSKVLEIIKTL